MLQTFTLSGKKLNKTEISQNLNNYLKNHPDQKTVTTALHCSCQRQIVFPLRGGLRFQKRYPSMLFVKFRTYNCYIIKCEIQTSIKQNVAKKIIILLSTYVEQKTRKIKTNILLNKFDPKILGTTKQIQDQLKI